MSEETHPSHTDLGSTEASVETPALEPLPLIPNVSGPPPRSSLHHVFIGTSGLRPGWGLLLFIALIVAFSAVSSAIVHRFHHPAHTAAQQKRAGAVVPEAPRSTLIIEGLSLAVVSFATWIMSRVERRRLGAYGFGGARKLAHLLAGLLWGALFLSLLVGALWKAGLLVFDARLLYGSDALRYGAIWALGFLLVGLFEESLLRGYLQVTLARGLASLYAMLFKTARGEALGFWTAALILSFIFGLGHTTNPGESPIGLISAGLIGIIFCLTLWRTGSLWWALGFHAAWDWAQSFLFGVADSGTMVQGHLFATHPVGKVTLSGGATGPEGSAFILPVLAVITLVIVWTLPARARANDLGLEDREPLAAD